MSSPRRLSIVVLGLSITSTWGNGHATTYRALLRALARRGHQVLFLERNQPWYAAHRDLPRPAFCRTLLYDGIGELAAMFERPIRDADLVIVGSYVPEGVAVGRFVVATARGTTAFYDIDTPVTLAKLARGDEEYVAADLIPRYQLYLSFTGGPTLTRIERVYGARMARPLYCAVDPELYFPEPEAPSVDLGYLGTYSADRQSKLGELMLEPARRWPAGRFAVAGPQYPAGTEWPANVDRIEYLPADRHRAFYGSQRFTLNLTRTDMVAAGFSPSVRLFEAAACGTPIISDAWSGLETVFEPGREILLATSPDEVLRHLRDLKEARRRTIAAAARARVLSAHTAAHRALELEALVAEADGRDAGEPAWPAAAGWGARLVGMPGERQLPREPSR
jgi:spore maturation protein CgeB